MIKPRLLLGVLATLACASCAVIPSTTFTEYRGADTMTGTGGTVRTVDGVDFWATGTPNRNYRILGVIDDSRTDAPIMKLMNQDAAIARVAKEHGGDAVILFDTSRKLSAVNASNGAVTYRNGTKLAVVKYLP
jgi:hypothetical protein